MGCSRSTENLHQGDGGKARVCHFIVGFMQARATGRFCVQGLGWGRGGGAGERKECATEWGEGDGGGGGEGEGVVGVCVCVYVCV